MLKENRFHLHVFAAGNSAVPVLHLRGPGEVLQKQKAFRQLEDFNQQKDQKAEEYHKACLL